MMNNRSQHSGHFGAAIRMPAASAVPDAEPVYRAGDTVMHPSEGYARSRICAAWRSAACWSAPIMLSLIHI